MHDDRGFRKMPRVLIAAAVLTICLVGCSDSSSSEDQGRGGGGGRLRSACQQDIARLCTNEQHPRQCLTNHETELSSSCKAALEDRGNRK